MKTTARLDVSPVGTYYAQLASMLKQDLPRTVRMEAAATVRRAMQFVESSKPSDVRERAMRKGVADFRTSPGSFGGTTNVSRRKGEFGRQWMVGLRGGGAKPMSLWSGNLSALRDHTGQGWRVPDTDWARYKAAWNADAKRTREAMKAKLGARGITAKSFYEILVKLNSGSTDGVAAFVTRARPISGRNRPVAFVGGTGEGSSQYNLTVVNTSGVAVATGGQRKLDSAITIRRKFFMDSMQRNFFFDAKFVARNYPWAKVT